MATSGDHNLAVDTGRYANGTNCGRFVRVTIERTCSGGINDGAKGKPFCRGGRLVKDHYTGASVVFQIADSCPADNAWCRTDTNHLDLDAASLAHYQGDVEIGFVQNSSRWWPTVEVTNLQRGISGIRYRQGGKWKQATVVGSRPGVLGNVWTIGAITANAKHSRIRILEAGGTAIRSGREYQFRLSSDCCSRTYTHVQYSARSPR
jgi:hypothetical protein